MTEIVEKNTFGRDLIPDNEDRRINALNSYAVLDGFPDKYFNLVAQTIAHSFNARIALISLVGSKHVEFKGNFGMEGVNQVDRNISLCSLAILDPDPTIFKDARKEPCLLNNPLVAGEFGLRFYAGVPIKTDDGLNIGTVCIVDKEPRNFSDTETQLLSRFADSVMTELKDRKILSTR